MGDMTGREGQLSKWYGEGEALKLEGTYCS